MEATAAAYVICGSCGCGCGYFLGSDRDGPSGVIPSPRHPASLGRLCRRGWNAHQPARDPARLRAPLLRKDGSLRAISWDEAISTVAAALKGRRPEEIGLVLSPTSTNEALYLASSLARSTLATPNIDFPGRHATAPMRVLSSRIGEMLCTIEDLADADLILTIGLADADRCPQLVPVIRRAVDHGVPVIAIDAMSSDLHSGATVVLHPLPHTDSAWIEAVGRFLSSHFTPGREIDEAARLTGLAPDAIRTVARRLGKAKRIGVVVDTASHGRLQDGRSIQAFASLMVLLRGSKDRVGLLPLFERCNTLCALDMGAAPGAGTGKGPRVGAGPGLTDMLDAAEKGQLTAMLLVGDLDAWGLMGPRRVRSALERLDFLAVASSFPTAETEMATLILPRPVPGEVEGSYTSTEGRVQTTVPYAETSIPQEWRLFADLSRALGGQASRVSVADVRAEIALAIPEYAPLATGASDFIRTFWEITPIPMDEPFDPVAAPATDADHPLTLTVERIYLPFAKDSTLLHSPILRRDLAILPQEPHLFLATEDAKALAVRDGSRITVASAHGRWSARAAVREEVPPGRIVLPEVFHEDASALLGERPRDALTGAPIYPAVAVSVVVERRQG